MAKENKNQNQEEQITTAEETVLEFKPQQPQEEVENKEDEKYKALYDKYLRLQADFDNFKKRNQATASNMYLNGVSDIIVEVLPVIDYLDMAITAQKDEEQRKGIELVKNAFMTILQKHGVEEMNCLGEVFDPNKHEAVMKREDSENSGKILEVLKKGYQRDGKVLRHPMVVVAE